MPENGKDNKEKEKLEKKEKKELEKQQKKEKKEKDAESKANQSLLKTQAGVKRRYATSELTQMWIVLKRALLFSRRDWVKAIRLKNRSRFEEKMMNFWKFLQTLMYLRLFAHILVGFLIGALYYDIGNDGAKVLSNLGFLFFNMLFLMYTSMTITILSCNYCSFFLEIVCVTKQFCNTIFFYSPARNACTS